MGGTRSAPRVRSCRSWLRSLHKLDTMILPYMIAWPRTMASKLPKPYIFLMGTLHEDMQALRPWNAKNAEAIRGAGAIPGLASLACRGHEYGAKALRSFLRYGARLGDAAEGADKARESVQEEIYQAMVQAMRQTADRVLRMCLKYSWAQLNCLMKELQTAARRSVEKAIASDDLATMQSAVEDASTLSAAIRHQTPPVNSPPASSLAAVLSRARSRIRELEAEATGRTELDALGLSAVRDPDDFVCPITHCKFVEPVVASDGHTYERSAITRVIESDSPLSPLTREKLEPRVTVNRALHRRMKAHQDETLKVAQLAAAQVRRQYEAAASVGCSASGDDATDAASPAVGGASDERKRGAEEIEASSESSSNKHARVAAS